MDRNLQFRNEKTTLAGGFSKVKNPGRFLTVVTGFNGAQ